MSWRSKANHVDPVRTTGARDLPAGGDPVGRLNINVFNVVLGGVLVAIGLTFWQSVLAILAGSASERR